MEWYTIKSVVFLCCVLCLRLFYTAEAIIKLPGNETIPALIMFGDSIVDTGSNNYIMTLAKCNFLPYGRDFQEGRPTGRFSNGKVPSDFIAEELGIERYIPSYNSPSLQPDELLTGVNFASGGSGYDPLTPKLQSVIPLPEQLKQFKEYIEKLKGNFGEERTNFILSKSLVFVVASSNDIANSYYASGIRKAQYDINSYTDMLSQFASSFIKEIYGLGARRIGVFGAPPVGCLPFERTLFGGIERKCSQEINMASTLFNAKLSAEMDYLNQNMPQAKVVYVDVYNPLLHIIENPTTYGFEVVDKGCCGTGIVEASILCNQLETETCADDSKYVFWDSYHPTERTYQILVDKIVNKYVNSFF
ncbi:GDSL esterase/lipase EXL3-like [Gastrolobium bilobum]|uniref:GDSL esterase/lipase EXL3-like n=1 Tax=Gastrolobium bilobum TaxID=150636 RepID=UPI002AAFC47C|nr:GDSL esterase/lipase EXL3-like [Gastrolobium bilobum]